MDMASSNLNRLTLRLIVQTPIPMSFRVRVVLTAILHPTSEVSRGPCFPGDGGLSGTCSDQPSVLQSTRHGAPGLIGQAIPKHVRHESPLEKITRQFTRSTGSRLTGILYSFFCLIQMDFVSDLHG